MPVTINGTTGISSDGGYTGDGVSFADGTPSNTLVTTTGGNVGIGTSSPTDSGSYGRALDVNGTTGAAIYARTNGSATNYALIGSYGSDGYVANRGAGNLIFQNNNAERARIDSSGNLLVGTTSQINSGKMSVEHNNNVISLKNTGTNSSGLYCLSTNNSGFVMYAESGTNTFRGSISYNGTGLSYNSASDYRLKDVLGPIQSALAKVALLKPCEFKWKETGEVDVGFIAHELQEHFPRAVTGEKDAVDAEGNPVYQGIDTSFLVATLTAAIQELKAELDSVKAELATLKGAQA